MLRLRRNSDNLEVLCEEHLKFFYTNKKIDVLKVAFSANISVDIFQSDAIVWY
jgi:hypothetical protein